MLKVWLAMFAALTAALVLAAGTGSVQAASVTAHPAGHNLPVEVGLTPSTPAPTATSVAPTADNTPTNPVNPGTGESEEQESTRLNWAPLVITAILLIVLISAGILWRRRKHKERL